MRDNVIGLGKPKELSKSSWECKVKKLVEEAQEKQRAKDAQEKTNGTQEPTSDVIKEPMIILSHWEKNKRQAQRGPARLR